MRYQFRDNYTNELLKENICSLPLPKEDEKVKIGKINYITYSKHYDYDSEIVTIFLGRERDEENDVEEVF